MMSLFNDTEVNSFHNWGINESDLFIFSPLATAKDGTIEAIKHINYLGLE